MKAVLCEENIGGLTDDVESGRTCIYKKFNQVESNQNHKSRDLKSIE